MPSRHVVKRWQALHTWSSLICTLFLLSACITGLPLVFSDQIEAWAEPTDEPAAQPLAASRVSVDQAVATVVAIYPGETPRSIVPEDEKSTVRVWLAPAGQKLGGQHFVRIDLGNGRIQGTASGGDRFLLLIRMLHVDLFTGLPGELFLGLMGILFVLAIVSGIALYGPFTRRLDFGTVRVERTRRTGWLDLHNLLGVVTLAWALAVGLTGVMNEMSAPLFALWRGTDVAGIIARYDAAGDVRPAAKVTVQGVLDTAQSALPGMRLLSIVYPGEPGSTAHHFVVWFKGASPLESRLFSPVLVDARSGRLTAVVAMPWYLRALEVSRPLHFGDYGGVPMQVIWALFDGVTIVVLGSGLYLWFSKSRRRA